MNRDWNSIGTVVRSDVRGNGVIHFPSSMNSTHTAFRGRSWFLWFRTRNLRVRERRGDGYQVANPARHELTSCLPTHSRSFLGMRRFLLRGGWGIIMLGRYVVNCHHVAHVYTKVCSIAYTIAYKLWNSPSEQFSYVQHCWSNCEMLPLIYPFEESAL